MLLTVLLEKSFAFYAKNSRIFILFGSLFAGQYSVDSA